jgi:hypothetical protein
MLIAEMVSAWRYAQFPNQSAATDIQTSNKLILYESQKPEL